MNPMRKCGNWLVGLMLGGTLGCASQRPDSTTIDVGEGRPAGGGRKIAEIVTQIGHVVSVNGELNFVVIEFPSGELPALGSEVGAYRENLKVGRIKISGPQQNLHTVGDVKDGRIRIGDEIRVP